MEYTDMGGVYNNYTDMGGVYNNYTDIGGVYTNYTDMGGVYNSDKDMGGVYKHGASYINNYPQYIQTSGLRYGYIWKNELWRQIQTPKLKSLNG